MTEREEGGHQTMRHLSQDVAEQTRVIPWRLGGATKAACGERLARLTSPPTKCAVRFLRPLSTSDRMCGGACLFLMRTLLSGLTSAPRSVSASPLRASTYRPCQKAICDFLTLTRNFIIRSNQDDLRMPHLNSRRSSVCYREGCAHRSHRPKQRTAH
jgi:hypothetical protein